MEPVGLAVGVIGLASLFGACLDAVDKIDDYKHYKNDTHSLATQFKAHKLRFQQWGTAVGIDKDKSLAQDHHESLDDPSTRETVFEILSIIKRVCNFEDEGPPPSGSSQPPAVNRPLARSMTAPLSGSSTGTKKQKFSWMLRGKIKRTAQIEQFGTLVQHLYHLVPPKNNMRVRPDPPQVPPASNVPQPMPGTDSSAWISELRQSLKRVEEEIEGDARREVHAWLIRDPPNELYDDNVQRKLDGTCNWILSREAFVDWFSSDFPSQKAKLLWVNGPAGFGKTVLCSNVVNHLSSNLSTPVAHFFFSSDFESRNDPVIAVRSWVSQVISKDNAAFDFVRERRDAQNEQVATRTTILQIFRQLVQMVPGCTFVIDGLDECTWLGQSNSSRGDSIANFLGKLGTAIANSSSRVLIVSRDEPEIRSGIEETKFNIYEYKITPEDVQGDVEIYSRNLVDKKLSKKSEAIKSAISQKMADRCGGQFLWLRMQEDSLRSWKNQKQLEDTIEKTPPGLDNLYERNLLRLSQLPEAERYRAFSLLRWAAFALRPLTVCEIAEAVLIDMEGEELPVDEMPDEVEDEYINSEILGLCGSLLNIRESSSDTNPGLRTVRITHFSVKQYFLSRTVATGSNLQANESLRFSNEKAENTVLAQLCLRYVHYEQVWQDGYKQEVGHVQGAFLEYAAGFWSRHLRLGDLVDEDANELIDALFDLDNPTWKSWKSWFDADEKISAKIPDAEGGEAINQAMSVTPVYYATRLDLTSIVLRLIEEYPDFLDEQSISGTTALMAACENNNEELARVLIQSGANVTLQNFVGRSPLHAVANGKLELARMLLENGANAMVGDVDAATPLGLAASEGHVDLARLLIEHGAEVTSRNVQGSTPLHWSVAAGHVDVARLLIDEGAELDAKCSYGQTPMYTAAIRGQSGVLRLLLERGADVDALDEDGLTPLMSAAYFGFTDVAHLLIEHGADVNATDNKLQTPLHYASQTGHDQTVALLIDEGADLEIAGQKGSPLNAAALVGHTEVVRLLLDHGARTDVAVISGDEDDEYWTPLDAAIAGRFSDVVQLLLESGVDPMAVLGGGWTPMTVACRWATKRIVELLFDYGANASKAGGNGFTPLHAAAWSGKVDIVELLLDKGADLAATDALGDPPLKQAIYARDAAIVRLLVERGADVHDDSDGWNALNLAASLGHGGTVQTLLHSGAAITAVDVEGWTALHCAAAEGRSEAVEVLIKNGADASVTTNTGMTSLHVAAADGYLDVVEMLTKASGTNLNQTDDYGRTALFYATMRGRLEVVQFLLSKKAEVNTKDFYDSTPLFAAARNGHDEIMKLLVATKGIDVVSKDGFGKSLLWWARRCNNPPLIKRIEAIAKLKGVKPSDNEHINDNNDPIYFDIDGSWCDLCTRCIPPGTEHFECGECNGGDFVGCAECVGAGVKCRVGSHEWTTIMSQVDGKDESDTAVDSIGD